MGRMLCIVALLFAVGSCGNNDADEVEVNDNDTTFTDYRGVENVNGNIPDTIATGAEPQTNYGDTSKEN